MLVHWPDQRQMRRVTSPRLEKSADQIENRENVLQMKTCQKII